MLAEKHLLAPCRPFLSVSCDNMDELNRCSPFAYSQPNEANIIMRTHSGDVNDDDNDGVASGAAAQRTSSASEIFRRIFMPTEKRAPTTENDQRDE